MLLVLLLLLLLLHLIRLLSANASSNLCLHPSQQQGGTNLHLLVSKI
jgi:hypothetical protein